MSDAGDDDYLSDVEPDIDDKEEIDKDSTPTEKKSINPTNKLKTDLGNTGESSDEELELSDDEFDNVESEGEEEFEENDPELGSSTIINETENEDVIIGSRYIEGGKIIGWSKRRHLLSFIANLYSKLLTFSNVSDMTSGFRIYKLDALEKIRYTETKSNGYAFQIEMTVLCLIHKLNIKEIPITFNERREGKSKMSKSVVLEAFPKVLILSLLRIKSKFLTTS